MKLFLATLVFLFFCTTPAVAAKGLDLDADGLLDADEISLYHTDPANADTDGDGYNDGLEITHGYSPLQGSAKRLRDVDTDGDGAWDDWEIALQTDLTNSDSDGDGYTDGDEVLQGYDPRTAEPLLMKKEIDVSLADQRLVYKLGDVVLDTYLISSGLPRTPTPRGSFTVLKKRPTVWYKGATYNYPDTKWNLMFKHGSSGLNYYLHGAFWHHDFGKVKSGGCVNLPYEYAYAGRLYDWADVGTPVEIR